MFPYFYLDKDILFNYVLLSQTGITYQFFSQSFKDDQFKPILYNYNTEGV